jgi:hypothetical protein
MLLYPTYNTWFNIYLHQLLEKAYMKYCVTCKEGFKPTGREMACSLKCRLLSNIEKKNNGCWIYKGTNTGPYGKVRWRQQHLSAHRASFIIFKGEIPEGKWVCHKCDVPKCINPDHLFAGSAQDNLRDAREKGRLRIGEKNKSSKLTDIQVEEMRTLNGMGISIARLSRIFNISFLGTYNILKNKYRRKLNANV